MRGKTGLSCCWARCVLLSRKEKPSRTPLLLVLLEKYVTREKNRRQDDIWLFRVFYVDISYVSRKYSFYDETLELRIGPPESSR